MKKSVFIIITVIVLALGVGIVRHLQAPVEVLVAKTSTTEDKIVASGLIVYSESVYAAGTNGTFYSYASEGERVGNDRLVATIYNGVVDKEVLQSLNNIDKKIADLEESIGDSTIYVSDESSEQAVSASIQDKVVDAVLEGDISQIQGYKGRLENLAGLETDGDMEEELLRLKAEKNEIEAEIGQSKRDIYSQNSGIYATMLDGLEGVVTPELLKSYMVADYKNLNEPEESIMGSRTVQKGEKVCKVVDNHIWYAASVLTAEQAGKLKEGQNVKLRVSALPGEVVEAKVDYISKEADGAAEYLVVVKCERYLEGVFNLRKSNIEIIINSFYGFEVPIHAIRTNEKGANGVMIRKSAGEVFRECNILSRNDEAGTVVIEPAGTDNLLQVGDLIVLGEK